MLRYTGGGFGGFLVGIPARDLEDVEVAELGGEFYLLSTGLYEKLVEPKALRITYDNKARALKIVQTNKTSGDSRPENT